MPFEVVEPLSCGNRVKLSEAGKSVIRRTDFHFVRFFPGSAEYIASTLQVRILEFANLGISYRYSGLLWNF